MPRYLALLALALLLAACAQEPPSPRVSSGFDPAGHPRARITTGLCTRADDPCAMW